MIMVNIHEAKAGLSNLIDKALKGELVTICRRNEPVAEIRAIATRRLERRPCGLEEGRLSIAPAFYEPLPAWWLDSFEGRDGAGKVHERNPAEPGEEP